MCGCLTSPNPLEVLVSVTGESPQPGESSYGRQLSRLAGSALANRYWGMYAGDLRQMFDTESRQFRDNPLLLYTELLAVELGEHSESGSLDEGKCEDTVPQVGPCPIDIWPDILPSFARWTLGSILLEKEAAIYLRMVSCFSVAKERFGVLKEQERQRDLRRLMTPWLRPPFKVLLLTCVLGICVPRSTMMLSVILRGAGCLLRPLPSTS